jgi:hypothetical protein
MGYFHDGEIKFRGQVIRFSAEEASRYESEGNYWHGSGDPSSWLGVEIFLAARDKLGEAPVEVAAALAAQVLGISPERMNALLDWHENYMRWHDGDWDYTVRGA